MALLHPRAFLTPILVVLSTALARGDVAPPPAHPEDRGVQLRFENLGDYPPYAFFLKYNVRSVGHGIRPNGKGYVSSWESTVLTPLSAENPTTELEGNGRRSTDVVLLAVPLGQKPPTTGPQDFLSWLKTNPPGVLQSAPLGIGSPSPGQPSSYWVKIEEERLEVRTFDIKRTYQILKIAGGSMLSLGLAVAGLALIRRRRPAKPAPTPPVE
jgi:hypothetical protein